MSSWVSCRSLASLDSTTAGKAGVDLAEAAPILPTKEKRKARFTGFDGDEEEVDDDFTAFQKEEQ